MFWYSITLLVSSCEIVAYFFIASDDRLQTITPLDANINKQMQFFDEAGNNKSLIKVHATALWADSMSKEVTDMSYMCSFKQTTPRTKTN